MTETRTTCPYCGVGCGVVARVEGEAVSVHGDKTHPANLGRLCVKGSALGETTGLQGRLLRPVVDGLEVDWAQALNAAGERLLSAPAGRRSLLLMDELGFLERCSPVFQRAVFTLLDDGDVIECGNYRLRCIATPGHTQGHICLYEEDQKIFFSGDHVLFDITPHIESWAYETNSLADYMASLDKVSHLAVDLVLPGHRNFQGDLKSRIDALKIHHRERAEEVLEVLGNKTLNAYEIAAGMTWDIDCETWEDFPIAQKWFATGEAIAHLRYLEGEGRISRDAGQKIVTFSAVRP